MLLYATEKEVAESLQKAGFNEANEIARALIEAGFTITKKQTFNAPYPVPKIDRDLIERMGKTMDGPWPRPARPTSSE